jgi:hypothetical protein
MGGASWGKMRSCSVRAGFYSVGVLGQARPLARGAWDICLLKIPWVVVCMGVDMRCLCYDVMIFM